jgi:Protein of unknown function (DUF3343)
MLRDRVSCRPTPTPQGLSTDICGVSVELLDHSQKQSALEILQANSQPPTGVYELP